MVDAGSSSVSSTVSNDLDGILRPQGTSYDVGAFEYLYPVGMPVIAQAVLVPVVMLNDGYKISRISAGDILRIYDLKGA